MITKTQHLRLINNDDDAGDQVIQKCDIGDNTIENFNIDQSGMPKAVEICIWRVKDDKNIFQSNRSFDKNEVELMIDYLTSLYNKMK